MAKVRQLPSQQQDTGLSFPGLISTLLGHVLTQQRQEESNIRLQERQTEANKQLIERQELSNIRTAERQANLDELKRQREEAEKNLLAEKQSLAIQGFFKTPDNFSPEGPMTNIGHRNLVEMATANRLTREQLTSIKEATTPTETRVVGGEVLQIVGATRPNPNIRKLHTVDTPLNRDSLVDQELIKRGFNSFASSGPQVRIDAIAAADKRKQDLESHLIGLKAKTLASSQLEVDAIKDMAKTTQPIIAAMDNINTIDRLGRTFFKGVTGDARARIKNAFDLAVKNQIYQDPDNADAQLYLRSVAVLSTLFAKRTFQVVGNLSDRDAANAEATFAKSMDSESAFDASMRLLRNITIGTLKSAHGGFRLQRALIDNPDLNISDVYKITGIAPKPKSSGDTFLGFDDTVGGFIYRSKDGKAYIRNLGD